MEASAPDEASTATVTSARKPKAHIYRQFPFAARSHRPAPRPFTQEITGSNPVWGYLSNRA